jgi:hypothetical protein
MKMSFVASVRQVHHILVHESYDLVFVSVGESPMKRLAISIVFLCLLLTACVSAPTATPALPTRTAEPTSTTTLTPSPIPSSTPVPTSTQTATRTATPTPAPFDYGKIGLPFHAKDVKIFKYSYRPIGDPCGFHAGDMIYVDTSSAANPPARSYEVIAPADGVVILENYIGNIDPRTTSPVGWEIRIRVGEDEHGPIIVTMTHFDRFYKKVQDVVKRNEVIGVVDVWKDNGRKELMIDFSIRHHPTGLGVGSYTDASGYFDPSPYLIDDLPPSIIFENFGPGYCKK